MAYTMEKRKQKMYIRAYLVLCLVILLSIGFYSYKKIQEYTFARNVAHANEELVVALKDGVADEITVYEVKKEDFSNLTTEINEKLGLIFPSNDGYIEMTRQMDEIEEDLSKKNNTFEISSLDK